MSNKINIEGKVENMKPTDSQNPKAPAGSFFCDAKKLTVWDKETWDEIEDGKSYEFFCTSIQNEYNGKTYTNYNVISVTAVEELVKSDLVLEGLPVFIDSNVKEIRLPNHVIKYLKEQLD